MLNYNLNVNQIGLIGKVRMQEHTQYIITDNDSLKNDMNSYLPQIQAEILSLSDILAGYYQFRDDIKFLAVVFYLKEETILEKKKKSVTS